ncbi:MAG TPA: adenylate/guanylate cyclase domain-containing protein [Luteibaculaceae bacterium]|nr:adenylate/guanylate cyclase domain-containing protein [Luteibaculaceae bacterium]
MASALLAIVLFYLNRMALIKRQKASLDRLIEEKVKQITEQKLKIEGQQKKLLIEKKKLDNILQNIFPVDVADELKSKGKVSPKHYSSVTVMFTDIKSFTQIAETYRPTDLVKILDKYFSKFDEIISKYRLEKIKTIGDSYMCAGGLPTRNKTHPVDMIVAALEIQDWITSLKKEFISKGEDFLDLKIGIHTGEATAGVVGKKRFAYDVWGNTVNVAHRMEETGVIEKVNISGKTHSLTEPFFDFTYRGQLPAKNKGVLSMYFVDGIKKELSVGGLGKEPTPMFWEYVNLHFYSKMDFRNLEKYLISFLAKNLPENLYYHGLHHTIQVERYTEEIALAEGIRGEELFYLKTAALLHDAGFTEAYERNEEIGAKIAERILPNFGYSAQQIERIRQLILATRVPQQPQNHLEKILCDADLFYLGSTDFHPIANALGRELIERGYVKTMMDWDKIQVRFLSEHVYHTDYARKKARPEKLARLEEIKYRLSDPMNYEGLVLENPNTY